jgi:hypothetical protein
MTLMMTMTPLQQGQQCQLEDGNNTITTRATTPLQIEGDNAVVMRATMPAPQQQGRLCINNGNNAIVMRATIAIAMMANTPAHQWKQRHSNVGNDASLTTSDEGNNASLTMVETPAH